MKRIFGLIFLLLCLLSTPVFAQDLTLVRSEDGQAIFSLEFSDNFSLATNSDYDQTAADGLMSTIRGKLVCRCDCLGKEMDMPYTKGDDCGTTYNGVACALGDEKGTLAECELTAIPDL